ncbi:MAG: S1C family serine protease [Acidimicrobiales bacterium]|nr:S1C family serine protease [Acidimicrobiales bacterium]
MDRPDDPGQDPAEPSDEGSAGGTSDVFGSAGFASMGSFDWSQIPDDPDTSVEESPTSKYPLHPDDRIWMHPSEVQYLAPDAGSRHRSSNIRRLIGVGLVGVVVGAAVAALVVGLIFQPSPQVVERIIEREITTSNVSAVTRATDGGSWSVADIAAMVTPSVVRIEVLQYGRVIGSGSGVIFRDDGHLITNAHVVEDGDSFRMVLAEGETFQVDLVGADPRTDIAVLQPMREGSDQFKPATLGNAGQLRAGETAIAIGSPLSLLGGPTVTVGVISATNRRLQSPQGDWLYELVQTDAPISPGSSGGALVDARGAVVGITTVIAVSEVGAEGLGFATPIEIAREVANDIIRWGRARHGRLGIRGQDALDKFLPPTHSAGVLVKSVDPAGPSNIGGVQAGDVIVELDGQPVPDMGALVVGARMLEPGKLATLRVWRDNQLLTVTVEVGELR